MWYHHGVPTIHARTDDDDGQKGCRKREEEGMWSSKYGENMVIKFTFVYVEGKLCNPTSAFVFVFFYCDIKCEKKEERETLDKISWHRMLRNGMRIYTNYISCNILRIGLGLICRDWIYLLVNNAIHIKIYNSF